MQHNPFIIPILDILKNTEQRLGEYDVIQQLEQQGYDFAVANESYQMALFKKHFITMNALYQLQQSLSEDGIHLHISALDICLQTNASLSESTDLSEQGEQKVRDYYLDWSHFDKADQQSVEQLLNDFWDRYFSVDGQAQALQTLGLSDDVEWVDVQKQYRRLAAQHHPDRGGDAGRFIEIREAYEVLCQCRRKSD